MLARAQRAPAFREALRKGNPDAHNLFSVIGELQRTSGVALRVEATGSER